MGELFSTDVENSIVIPGRGQEGRGEQDPQGNGQFTVLAQDLPEGGQGGVFLHP